MKFIPEVTYLLQARVVLEKPVCWEHSGNSIITWNCNNHMMKWLTHLNFDFIYQLYFCPVRGLWPLKRGTISFSLTDDSDNAGELQTQDQTPAIYYLPQKPFLSDNGSLRQLIAYPTDTNNSIAETQWIVDKLNRYFKIIISWLLILEVYVYPICIFAIYQVRNE